MKSSGLAPRSIVVGVLIIVVLAIYYDVVRYPFILFDDNVYITENPRVRAGLSLQGVAWAFTSTHASNWHPLTWLSHMADVELFGMDAGKHHMVSVLLHLCNTVLLFLAFHRMTGALWRSGFAAALFAVHPLHVESVAWIAERKDVLCTLFFLLALWAYSRYAERPCAKRYAVVVLCFVLGLLAKPMVVTLPFVLLLLDFWPLGRIQGSSFPAVPSRYSVAPVSRLLTEKILLLGLAAASCAVTVVAQGKGGALRSLEIYPFRSRVSNALVSYVGYLGKAAWPSSLAVYYPHPGNALALWEVAGSALLLGGLTFAAVRLRKRSPYIPVGWFWYLGTLVPVIGLVQVGTQSMADRYTYIPSIGVFLVVSWGIHEAAGRLRIPKPVPASVAGIVIAALAVVACAQAGKWRGSVFLFRHAVEVTSNNSLAYNNLGLALEEQGKIGEAEAHYRKALGIAYDNDRAHNNLAENLSKQGKLEEAMTHYREALRIRPANEKAHNNFGVLLMKQGKIDDAIFHYREALKIDPNNFLAYNNLGNAMLAQGKYEEAFVFFREALRIMPDYADPHYNMGMALFQMGFSDEAARHFREVLRLRPNDSMARALLGMALKRGG